MMGAGLALAVVLCAVAGSPSGPEPLDCGAAALYQLMRLEGKPVRLEKLLSSLGAAPAEGRTFLLCEKQHLLVVCRWTLS